MKIAKTLHYFFKMVNLKTNPGKVENVELTNAIAKGGEIYVPLAEAQSQLIRVVNEASKRKYRIDPNQSASAAGMRKFASLPADLQDTKTKLACILCVLVARKMDVGRYWSWVYEQTILLRRTFDFDTTCKVQGKNPQYVAEHLVLQGKKACTNIRLNGLATYNGDIKLFGDPLIPEESRKLFITVANKPTEADTSKDDLATPSTALENE